MRFVDTESQIQDFPQGHQPRRGAPTKISYLTNFLSKCMKMKNFRLNGLDLPMEFTGIISSLSLIPT